MATKPISSIAQMDWDQFAQGLIEGTRGSRGTRGADEQMREYFGEEEYAELQAIAKSTKSTRSRGTLLGNIVFLPGIMGSHLVAMHNRLKEHLVWMDLLALVRGEIKQLQLAPDGRREADGKIQVRTSTIDKRTYSRAILTLMGKWNVLPFAYDWRKGIDQASHALAAFIGERFRDEPVHLVAHSMGGLVCRNFIRLHKKLWESMRSDNNRGGMLIMMGTPNRGSFVIPQALSGEERLVRLLATADLRHDMSDVLNVLNTFVGTYQMLPWSQKPTDKLHDLYYQETWGNLPISPMHLNAARDFHKALDDGPTIDPERMRYIAGCNQQTLSDVDVLGQGEFAYKTSFDGDGRVPFTLGLLEGVPTYYIEEDHGSLPKNKDVLVAVGQLLETGRTAALLANPVRGRAGVGGEARWSRFAEQSRGESDIARLARAARDPKLRDNPEDRRVAEETLIRAAVGSQKPVLSGAAKVSRRQPSRRPPRTSISVAWGDITKAKAPVVVVGHYKGVTPINAIGAIDKRLHHWIRDATRYSMIGGDLGQLFFIPVRNKEIAADVVLVAGMGQEGTFDRHDLRYLMMNVTLAISRLGVDRFATILIGAGAGNLETEQALQAMMAGISAALDRLNGSPAVKQVMLVERVFERRQTVREQLKKILSGESLPGLELDETHYRLGGGIHECTIPSPKTPGPSDFGPRITIEREGSIFRFSALTRTAVVPVREVEIQSFFQEGLADRLSASSTRAEQEKLGLTLHAILMPEDFQKCYEEDEPLTLVLDRSTAWIPWEMACFQGLGEKKFFGTDLQVTRQFRTLLSSTPGIVPREEDKLRVLVIADPAQEPELQLGGAQREGKELVQLLDRIRQVCSLEIDITHRIGAAECDPIEILTLLLAEEFDVVHFAGHGMFDEMKPSQGGWIFGFEKGATDKFRTLSAREIFRTRHVPRLVFSNACFSAVVNKGKAFSAEETNRKLAGLAEAFFERGVQDYIGAGWPVSDDPAVSFALEFYAHLLTGRPAADFAPEKRDEKGRKTQSSRTEVCVPDTFGKAIEEARRSILFQGSTWGAYQHYGMANARLLKGASTRSVLKSPR